MQNDGNKGPVVITPGQAVAPAQPDPPPNTQTPEQQPTEAQQTTEQPQTEPNDDNPVPGIVDGDSVEWSASEFMAHNKGIGWYLGLSFVIVVVAAIVYIFVKSIFTSIMVLLIGLAFGIAGARQPRTLEYGVNAEGVKIGERFYPYSDFKSFSIAPDGAVFALVLTPFKRLSPPISVYYEEKDEDRIMTIVSNNLPHEEHVKDPVEQLMRKVKF